MGGTAEAAGTGAAAAVASAAGAAAAVAPAATTDGVAPDRAGGAEGTSGENAPWKSQRKRARRAPGGDSAKARPGSGSLGTARGLAEYHNALIGA
eukprot:NODE_9439_length_341_cov_29.314685.p3 GENE.NODE_9439_length_341_cov_29.314685~~NODE_9439_length_341_cov_29.314685.p3  ORF type:complete len:95 (-),score=12.38 NODE_9439_length_341_cov_29.314685:39-323(-)